MFEINLKSAVSAIVEAVLPRSSPGNEGLLVCININMWGYGSKDDDRRSVSRNVEFLFVRPTNYTKVMARVEHGEWKMYSDHDSAWREDGFRILGDLWQGMHDEVAAGHEKSSDHTTIRSVSRVRVELEKYDDSRRGKDSWRPVSVVEIKP